MISVMGLDPGVSGAASVLNIKGDPIFVSPFRPDMTETDAVNNVQLAVNALRKEGGNICYFEKTGFRRGDGGKGAWTFGFINGLCRGALLALKVEVRLVPPTIWMMRLNCLTGGNKEVSRRRAQQIFPSMFPKGMFKYQADNIADSLLISRYGWEQMGL